MTNNGNDAQAARWPVRDPRTYEQMRADKAAVREQVAALSEPNVIDQAASQS